MENDFAEVEEVPPSSYNFKLYKSTCEELVKFIDKIFDIFLAIESTRPGGRSGIQELCSLNLAIEKAKLLLQHCAGCSKLYLAITSETNQLRFERLRNALLLNLCKLQSMVPQPLAAQVSDIVSDLQEANLVIDSTESEVGRALVGLIHQRGMTTDPAESFESSELEVFLIALQRLDITSSKALLIEKRLVRRLLGEVNDLDTRKKNILKYLLHLLNNHVKFMGSMQSDNFDQFKVYHPKLNFASTNILCENHIEHKESRLLGDHEKDKMNTHEVPPEEFICPISWKLMLDPVVIASGITYERKYIEKWFSEGHYTCPKTLNPLPHLSVTPNTCLKDLIKKWCTENGVSVNDPSSIPNSSAFSPCDLSTSSSISSLSSSLNGMPVLTCRSSADYLNESDTSNASISSSDARSFLDSSYIVSTEKIEKRQSQIFSWTDSSGSFRSFAHFDHEMYSKFFLKLSDLPIVSQEKAVVDFKILLEENIAACHSINSSGFVKALMKFLSDACAQSNINAQRTGLRILEELISNTR